MKPILQNRKIDPDRKSLSLWAADCAEHVLHHFEEHHSLDDRPRKAIEAARAWARGEITCGLARSAAFATHAAARAATNPAAVAAARAAGHAAGTAHMARHARPAADYAAKAEALSASGETRAIERAWQIARLAEHLRPLAFVDHCDK